MSETITIPEATKFTDDEMIKLRGFQKSFQDKIHQLGQLKFEQIKLADKMKNLHANELSLQKHEDILKKEFLDLQTSEAVFVEECTKKYGQGSLNYNTGEFTPQK